MENKVIANVNFKVKHSIIYQIPEIKFENENDSIYITKNDNIEIIATGKLTSENKEGEIYELIGNNLLKKFFNNKETNIREQIPDFEINKNKKYKLGHFLIINKFSELDLDSLNYIKLEDFNIIINDQILNSDIKKENNNLINKVIVDYCVSHNHLVSFIERSNTVIFYNNKDVFYNFNFHGNEVDLTLTKSENAYYFESVKNNFQKITQNNFDSKIENAFKQNFEEKDNLKAFLFIWIALEIFINTTFKSIYKSKFFEPLLTSKGEINHQIYSELNDILKDKINIKTKFDIIASILSTTVKEDSDFFKSIKRKRDKYAHGEEILISKLENNAYRSFLIKYLKLHSNFEK